MLDNMTGEVGNAIVADRLARALKNARITEAMAARKADRRSAIAPRMRGNVQSWAARLPLLFRRTTRAWLRG
jgi:hypothetical protein